MTNKDIVQGVWSEIKGKAMQQWSKLTNDDFTEFKGNWEEFKGKIQKLYGYTKEQAESEFSKFMNQNNPTATLNKGAEKLNDSIDQGTEKLFSKKADIASDIKAS